mmetsp:Transcript_19042/g.42440  ORF Transcript_19042/g.42440 Transcript_19042/m.42440 type:complete len:377 (-) Transcript_19042:35-1165(-)
MPQQLFALLLNLQRQLSRRRHDHRERALLLYTLEVYFGQVQQVADEGHHEGTGLTRPRLGDTHDVSVRHAHRYGLSLDRRGLLVPSVLYRLHHCVRKLSLCPVPQRQRRSPPLDADVEVLSENAPVSLRHVCQLLVRPVPPHLIFHLLVDLLQLVLAPLLEIRSCAFSLLEAVSLLALCQVALPLHVARLLHALLAQGQQKARVLALLFLVHAGDVAAPVQGVDLHAVVVERVHVVLRRVVRCLPVELEHLGEFVAGLCDPPFLLRPSQIVLTNRDNLVVVLLGLLALLALPALAILLLPVPGQPFLAPTIIQRLPGYEILVCCLHILHLRLLFVPLALQPLQSELLPLLLRQEGGLGARSVRRLHRGCGLTMRMK